MYANLDESLNDQFGSGLFLQVPLIDTQIGAPPLAGVGLYSALLAASEDGSGINDGPFPPYPECEWGLVSVYSKPAIIPTAAPGKNPWDGIYSPAPTVVFSDAAPTYAAPLPPQISQDGL